MAAGTHQEIIERWMLSAATDGGIRRLDELHIDDIDPEWKSKSEWLSGGLVVFRLAVEIRDRHKLPLTVGVGFSLEAGEELRGVDFHTSVEFRERFDWSPPSL